MSIFVEQQPSKLILAQQPVVFKLSTDTPGCRLFVGLAQGNGDSAVPDQYGAADFEVSDYVKGLILVRGWKYDIPNLYAFTPKKKTFLFAEIVEEVYQQEQDSDEFSVLDGKVPERWRLMVYKSYQNLLQYLVASKKCLTWYPEDIKKKVLPDQKEFLNYLQVQSLTPIWIKLAVSLILDDDSVVAGPVQSSYGQSISYLQLLYFPTGYTQLGIPAFMTANHPDRVVISYSVCVMATGINDPVSAIYHYLVDRNYHESTRQLWIRNPYGLWEVLLCTGLSGISNEHKPETAGTDGSDKAKKIVWKNQQINIVKANTGFLTRSEVEWLSDLLDTTEAYELIDGVLQPIVFRDNKIASRHDGEYQYYAELEYEYSYTEPVETE